jgi:acyl-coenzyme A synthetase/AMP-(fatty) acid ligase
MAFDYAELCSTWNPWSFIPHDYNLGVALTTEQVAQGRGDKPALLWENAAGSSRVLTYAQMDALTNRFASSLQRLGVQKGGRVFLRLPNVPEFYVAALAIAKLGAIFIPSSTQFRTSEVEYRLKDSGAVAAVTTTNLAEVFDHVRPACPELNHVIVVPYPDSTETRGAEYLDYGRLIDQGSEIPAPGPTLNDDIAFIAYTSGTMGDPKGVVHRHRYPIAYESLIRLWHDYRPEDRVACPSELGWLLPLASTFLYALGKGLTVVLYDSLGGKFEAERWFDLFQRYRITNFTAPPTTYRMLMAEAAAAPRYDMSSWRHAVAAGEPLPADTLEAIRRHFGVQPLDGIGMSECMVYCFNMVGMPIKAGSCGRPGPGTTVALMDEEWNPVPDGADGVLCVRCDTHPGMMKEYWNKPERTAEILRGPWYYSGDILSRDKDGYLWFKGRADDVIKAAGYRISPFEVESCLMSHPAVLEAATVESPDPVRGNVVKAFVVLRPGYSPEPSLAAMLQKYVKQSIAPYKYPRQVEFLDVLPKTVSGKVKRRELRERASRASEADGRAP